MILATLASRDLHRRIRTLESDVTRITALLGQRLGSICTSDLCSGMAFVLEDIDQMRAEVHRRACSPSVVHAAAPHD
jgi:hypothetical protein